MKSRILKYIAVMTVCAMAVISARLVAQNQPAQGKRQVRYTITNLGTLGGTSSNASGINNRGWSVGDANLAGDGTEHASLWRNGVITDLVATTQAKTFPTFTAAVLMR